MPSSHHPICLSKLTQPALTLLVMVVLPILVTNSQQTTSESINARASSSVSNQISHIDPALILPGEFSNRLTVKIANTTTSELSNRLTTATSINVVLDSLLFEEEGFDLDASISIEIKDEPVYLLFDRLADHGIHWRLDKSDVILYPESLIDAHSIETINIGRILQLGYQVKDLKLAIESCIGIDSWVENGGDADVMFLNDVMFLRQNGPYSRQVAGLVRALESPTRQTFLYSSELNRRLSQVLDQKIEPLGNDLSLAQIVNELNARTTGTFKLDPFGLSECGYTEIDKIAIGDHAKTPRQVLQAIRYIETDLDWAIRDGAVYITEGEERALQSAVYNISDICVREKDMVKLTDTIQTMIDPDSWLENGGIGHVCRVKDGVLLVTASYRNHEAILRLIESYQNTHTAGWTQPNWTTRYYRVPTPVANELATQLPKMIDPASWHQNTEAPYGQIQVLASWPGTDVPQGPADIATGTLIDHSVLIIYQTVERHEKITNLIFKIKKGDYLNPLTGIPMSGPGSPNGGLFDIGPVQRPNVMSANLK